jgi:hypothetical protein
MGGPAHSHCACGGSCPRCEARSGRSEGESTPTEEVTGPPETETGGETGSADPLQGTPAAAPAVSTITPNIGSSGSTLAHVPACTGQPTIRFTAAPANAAPITWSLAAGSAAVETGTALTPSTDTRTADLSLGAAQTGGTLEVSATNGQGGQVLTYPLASHPTAITSTSREGDPTSASDYGGVFDHVFTSNDSRVASLENVAVGERFPNLPNPNTATHTFATPFGQFTLTTGTLPNAASATSGNWFLTSGGKLGGTHDNVTIAKSMVDIGKHLVSDSNPTPTDPLPAGFTVDQDLHWWCPHSPAGSRWTHFASTTHTRRLRVKATGTDAEFVAIVNSKENKIDYDGPTGVTNAVATPATVAPSSSGGTANTVQISATSFPSTASLHFSIRGSALGCTIDSSTGVLTIGTQTGSVKVRVANTNGGPNWDEVDVTIATPPPPTVSPTPNPTSGTGTSTEPPVGEEAPPVSS